MKAEYAEKIEEIIGHMKCPKNFKCAESGFKNLCKARDFGLERHLECLEADPQECRFSLSHGRIYFCQCPLRVYLSKKLMM